MHSLSRTTRSSMSGVRTLHVQAAPTHSPITPTTNTTATVPPQTSAPLYTTLGQPPSLLQISLTPSLPTLIQRKALIALAPIKDVYSTPYWLSPLKRIVLGLHTWRFQQLESTVPASALVKAHNGKALYVLSMDGKEDFAVFPKNAVLSFAGPALRVDTHRVPLKVTKTVEGNWISTKNETKDTGLARNVGYSLLQGRGDAVLQGVGEVYKLVLGAEEEIVVKRDSLLGVSITGELDCIEKWETKRNTATTATATPAVELVEPVTEITTVSQWDKFKTTVSSVINTTRAFTTRAWALFKTSSSGYLKITGPRTVLLQSGTATSAFGNLAEVVKSGQPISIVEQKIQQEALKHREHKPEDLLSYAVVKDGKVTFHSTPDFKETVQKYENAGGKKDV
ncbi:Altered inheritance of mitochondria protein 24, mitochondrial [Cyberlindnera fabianii]|uniref:Altered inheritance of mitochondria protein 24, mitochondrial n=1 Tax=Cyberlindnera fabianii TaxID=36022 RepID=A0A1V2L9M4_CYBFA|nr:Altered inheritance of mitochondria protein 24, mitochondrial [Cyberlindnera fabianii]